MKLPKYWSPRSSKILFHRSHYDAILASSPPPTTIFLARFAHYRYRAPYYLDIRDIWPEVLSEIGILDDNNGLAKKWQAIMRKVYNESSRIITVTKQKQHKLTKSYHLTKEKVVYIPNGIDGSIKPAILSKKLIKPAKKIIIWAGTIGYATNTGPLLFLAERYQTQEDIEFLIIGEGVMKERLEKEISNRKLRNIKIIGLVSHETMVALYQKAFVSIVSQQSIRQTDWVSVRLLESLGYGCPVIGLVAGESATIINDSQGGYVVPPQNERALTKAFDNLLRLSPSRHRLMRSHAKLYIAKHYIRENYSPILFKTLEGKL